MEALTRDPVWRPYVTVGFFDGVHLGHEAILAELREMAVLGGGSTVVITFDAPGADDGWQGGALNYTGERLERLAAADTDGVLLLDFGENLRGLEATRFVERYIVKGLDAAGVCVGYDHRFGRDGAGDFSLAAALGKKYGFEVRAAAPLAVDGRVLSSTFIRGKVRSGDITAAARLLGYRYEVEGVVVSGTGLGATELGYPTANLDARCKLLPGYGVYAAFVYVGRGGDESNGRQDEDPLYYAPINAFDGPYGAFLNIGTRPTVSDSGAPTFEVHLFAYSGDMVGRKLRVRFVGRIREERKFRGLSELRGQLAGDEATAREMLLGAGEPFL